MAEHDTQAEPVVVQGGVRLIRSAPLVVETFVQIERSVALSHIRNGTAEFRTQKKQGLARPMCFLAVSQGLLASRIGPEKQPGRFREGPREMGVPDLRARGARPLPRRLLRALDQTALREAIWDPREAGAIMDVVAQHQAQDLANAGDRTQQGQRLG